MNSETEVLEAIRELRVAVPKIHDLEQRMAGRVELVRLQARLLELRRKRGACLAPVLRVETLHDPPPYARRRRRGPSDGCSAEVGA